MRMRRKKNLEPRTARCEKVHITEPQALKGKWEERFGRKGPLWLEIGCGKGRFVLQMAQHFPQVNFVAVERDPSAFVIARKGAMELGLGNVLFLNQDAIALADVFDKDEVERLFLNFSDP